MEFHATTILAVRRNGAVAIGGDGQVSLGNTIVKADATKIRRLAEGSVLVGFAGSAADSFALMERFEARLKDHPANLPRAATALAKRARRRAISVLPTPVGPIMMMFLGITSSAISSSSIWRRMRLRRAMATAFLAACWPTT